MGQYYQPIIFCYENGKVKILAWLYSWSFMSGSKLTEHSYLRNSFVNAVESLLIPGGAYHNARLVWAGDYADGEPDDPEGRNLYHQTDEVPQHDQFLKGFVASEYPYIVNHSKHQYVLKAAASEQGIHPLPLLTAEGNGRGGGDYRGSEEDKVGMWARDIISVEKEPPSDYIELKVSFNEAEY